VGPRSAGAKPGPACYGQGGGEPTVTDANMVLGYLNPDYFLGGKMKVDPARSQRALEGLAQKVGSSPVEAALAVHRIVNANMAAAIRVVSVERGYDPRDFTIVAYGAAGPTHAARLAALMNVPKVIVPEAPGAFCCWGFLVADVMHDYHRSYVVPTAKADLKHIQRFYREMEEAGLARVQRDGIPRDKITFIRTMDLRYIGQAHEVTVPVSGGAFGAGTLQETIKAFHRLHERYYAIKAPGEPTEITTLGVKAIGLVKKRRPARHRRGGRNTGGALKYTRKVFFEEAGKFIDCPAYDRYRLAPGNAIAGPAIVEQIDSTVVLPPRMTAIVDLYQNLVITVR